ncbi:hypothetical protein AB6A40_006182 [Gnathostoma spinigerum]|uniref:Uncharacterized protein n=1 Tax=Gnathostoma spinigerum TaxID=75299 RepID=A0ABD6EHT9_9BILA
MLSSRLLFVAIVLTTLLVMCDADVSNDEDERFVKELFSRPRTEKDLLNRRGKWPPLIPQPLPLPLPTVDIDELLEHLERVDRESNEKKSE